MSGLTDRQREVLMILARHNLSLTTGRINALVGRKGVSARGVLARLEAGGLVSRETSHVTGRHRWKITDRGRVAS